MTLRTLIVRGFRYHGRKHATVAAGTAVATAVLAGALLAGHSVRESLLALGRERLGDTEFALERGGSFFRTGLAGDLAARASARTAAMIHLTGSGSCPAHNTLANRIELYGVDETLAELGAPAGLFAHLTPDETVINSTLAERLRAGPGDTIILRVRKPGALPPGTPFTAESDAMLSRRYIVRAVTGPEHFGRFSLKISQLDDLTAFVAREPLAEILDRPERSNLLLMAGAREKSLSADEAAATLASAWSWADAGLRWRRNPDDGISLESSEVFLPDPVIEAARAAEPAAEPVFTYLVNEARCGARSSAYFFAAALDAPPVPEGLADDEVVINPWLARDLQALPGATIELRWYTLGKGTLVETSGTFTVRAVIPLSGAAADRSLMPDIPGLTDADRCGDWDSGLPFDLKRITDRDEDYWNEYRGTPRLFLRRAAGLRAWANPFGSATAIRFPGGTSGETAIRNAVRGNLSADALDLRMRPVAEQAKQAALNSVDFGSLVAGLSFFLIVSALILTGLLHALAVEHRTREIGTLLAVGFRPGLVLRLLRYEGLAVAVAGGLAGAVLAVLYNEAVIAGLRTVWRGAVGTSALRAAVDPLTLAAATIGGLLMAWGAMWAAGRRIVHQPVRRLVAGRYTGEGPPKRRYGGPGLLPILPLAGAGALTLYGLGADPAQAQGLFFGAGTLMLAGTLWVFHRLLAIRAREAALHSALHLALRGLARRRGRNLAAAGVLACGVFLVVAVGANRRPGPAADSASSSGTGGFSLYGESALPLPKDPGSPEGRSFYALAIPDTARLWTLPAAGIDEASCLNLNAVALPRLLGIPARTFAERGAFAFAATANGRTNTWTALAAPEDDGVVPAAADLSMITWNLKKKLGDELTYTDEQGRPFRVRLVAGLAPSIFQGSVLIDESALRRHFPSAGRRVLLADVSPAQGDALEKDLLYALQDYGLELTTAARRLDAFTVVENTYLNIFLALGGLGLLLGGTGLGIVLLRNALERRREMAVLRAVGFARRTLRHLLFIEHAALLAAGLAAGSLSAAVAVLPALRAGSRGWAALGGAGLAVLAILAVGCLGVMIAAREALRADLSASLKEEP